jgi:hypothetical protein
VIVLHPEAGKTINKDFVEEVAARNRQLTNYKRIHGYLSWNRDFPLTASMKIKRGELAEQIRGSVDRSAMVTL